MKSTRIRMILLILCALTLLALASCAADMDIGDNTILGEQFMDHVIADDYDAAYGLVKETVSDGDFRAYWTTIRSVMEGAEAYEMEQIGWNVNRSGGLTTRTTAYQVYPDNGRTVLLRVVTRDDIAGIAGIHFSDVTAFLAEAETVTPVVGAVLLVFSLLVSAFVIWMLVDCLRRKMKTVHKILWALLIFGGVALTVTVGQSSGIHFQMGLMLQASSITADPGLQAFVTKLVVPLGAILYCCLRKRFTQDPEAPASETPDV